MGKKSRRKENPHTIMQAIFAYSMLTYVLASVYYLVATASIGTPFKNSLSPEQRAIQAEAAAVRRRIFFTGLAGAAVGLAIVRPF